MNIIEFFQLNCYKCKRADRNQFRVSSTGDSGFINQMVDSWPCAAESDLELTDILGGELQRSTIEFIGGGPRCKHWERRKDEMPDMQERK